QPVPGSPPAPPGAPRPGGLAFPLAQPITPADANALLRRLRVDRSVLWAEPIRPSRLPSSSRVLGNKLMVRLVGDPTPDWDTLLPRWADLTGAPLTVERQIGNVWVLSLPAAVPEDTLAQVAEQLQADAQVQYADAATRAHAMLVPNDPNYSQQWALFDPVGGVNAPAAWDLQTGSAGVTVAVLDTGSTQHPDLAGRFL